MSYTVEHDDKAETYRCVVIRLSADGLNHRCGYVSTPVNHPFHGKGYEHEIDVPDVNAVPANHSDPVGMFTAACRLANEASKLPISYMAQVHGGITYAGNRSGYPVTQENPWWFGFDAAHCDDDRHDGGRPLSYMIDECHKLRAFLQAFTIEPQPKEPMTKL
jgi:hypothetical protein